jgi:hypothetical protein
MRKDKAKNSEVVSSHSRPKHQPNECPGHREDHKVPSNICNVPVRMSSRRQPLQRSEFVELVYRERGRAQWAFPSLLHIFSMQFCINLRLKKLFKNIFKKNTNILLLPHKDLTRLFA